MSSKFPLRRKNPKWNTKLSTVKKLSSVRAFVKLRKNISQVGCSLKGHISETFEIIFISFRVNGKAHADCRGSWGNEKRGNEMVFSNQMYGYKLIDMHE